MIEDSTEISAEKTNMFPAKHGISLYYSPEAIVMQWTLDYKKHCKYSFGDYVQAHNKI